MATEFNNKRASNELINYIARTLNFNQMNDFKTQYSILMNEYNNSNLSLLSTIKVERLDSFKKWTPNALVNKQEVFPLLVCKMLMGDIFALSIYDNLKKIDGDNKLVFDYMVIHQNDLLKQEFRDHGGSEDGRAILTAEHWLASEESVSMLGATELGNKSLCLVNDMLHIVNQHLVC